MISCGAVEFQNGTRPIGSKVGTGGIVALLTSFRAKRGTGRRLNACGYLGDYPFTRPAPVPTRPGRVPQSTRPLFPPPYKGGTGRVAARPAGAAGPEESRGQARGRAPSLAGVRRLVPVLRAGLGEARRTCQHERLRGPLRATWSRCGGMLRRGSALSNRGSV